MSGSRRFSSAPVNFDRFVVLARSNSRSLSPDHELHQMLRPFQSRAAPATSPATRESVMARECEPAMLLVNKDLAETQVRDCSGAFYVGSTSSRRPTDDDTVSSTRAATSTSRSVSGGGAGASSAGSSAPVSASPTYYPRPVSLVGAETQELGHSPHSTDEVDLLLQATLQLGSPLYDPVRAQFVCWRLHPLRRRPSGTHGAFEGISCDFCGHTQWFEAKGKVTKPAPSVKGESEDDAEGTEKVATTSSKADSIAFYRCAICEVDICRACLDEVHADARFHLPCLQCGRCGAYESRRDAPLHRCATAAAAAKKKAQAVVLVDSGSDEEEREEVRASLAAPSSSSCSVEDATQTPPLPPPSPSPPRRRSPRLPVPASPAAAGLKHKGVPVGSPVRLGLARRPPVAFTTAAEPQEDDAAAPPTHKRRRASPPTAPSPKQPKQEKTLVKEETEESLLALSTAAVADQGKGSFIPPRQPVVGAKRAAPTKKEEDNAGDDATRALLEATVLPFARYEVHVTPRSADEVEEVVRFARELHLLCAAPPTAGRACVYHFATRLAAEACVDRAIAASLDALLTRHTPTGR